MDWSHFCREVCYLRCNYFIILKCYCFIGLIFQLCVLWIDHINKPIGGEGIVVEIDECKIWKRKYNKGCLIADQWIFGGVERNTNNVFIVPVENRSSTTLLNIMKQWIKPCSIIISDCWKAYNCLKDEGYQYLIVNHKLNFVDPKTNANTQNIERIWREM